MNFFGRLRLLYNTNLYGVIYVYASFWTLLKHVLVFFASVFGHDETRDSLLAEVKETFREKFDVPANQEIVIGETARSLFYAFLVSLDLKEDDIVITTPLQHYSFIRIYKAMKIKTLTVDMKTDGSGWDWETLFKHLTRDQQRRCRALIVTHMFGFNQAYDEMAQWCHDNDVIIFEDCIQGYTVYQYHGHPLAHMSVFSGGMDKIPCTTKGGFAIVRHSVPSLSKGVENVILNFPEPDWGKRLKDLASQWGYWFLISTKLGCFCIMVYGLLFKGFRHIHVISQYARSNFLKAYVGKFTVDRISWCPSIYHLKSMLIGIRRTDKYWVDMLHESRQAFRKILGEKYCNIVFPWQNGGDWLKEHANLYFHCVMREREEACELMSDNGWLLMHQQAWDFAQQLPGHPEPKYAQYLKHNLAYFTVTHQMLTSEMHDMANVIRGHLDKYHGDGKPVGPEDYMGGLKRECKL